MSYTFLICTRILVYTFTYAFKSLKVNVFISHMEIINVEGIPNQGF